MKLIILGVISLRQEILDITLVLNVPFLYCCLYIVLATQIGILKQTSIITPDSVIQLILFVFTSLCVIDYLIMFITRTETLINNELPFPFQNYL